MEHECPICGDKYEKKPKKILFEDLPETWRCPLCNTPKKAFIKKSDDTKNKSDCQ